MNRNNTDGLIITVSVKNILLITILTSIFIILKIFELIKWDWVWVISPLWIDTLIMIVLYIIVLFTDTINNIKNK